MPEAFIWLRAYVGVYAQILTGRKQRAGLIRADEAFHTSG